MVLESILVAFIIVSSPPDIANTVAVIIEQMIEIILDMFSAFESSLTTFVNIMYAYVKKMKIELELS